MIFSLTLAELLVALCAYGIFSLFCPYVSLLYCIGAAGGIGWEYLLYWIAGSLACVLLASGIRLTINAINKNRKKHLLERVDESWALLLISGIPAIAATLWNGRFLLPLWTDSPTGIAASVCLILSVGVALWKSPKVLLSYNDISATLLACAIVLTLSPVSLSPLLCISTCICAFSLSGFKELLSSHLVLPLMLFVLSRLVKDDPSSIALLISAIIISALILYILKLKRDVRDNISKLQEREKEMDMDRRRMDDLELGIVKNERESLLNMLELRRKEITQVADKLTAQRTFMQDVYNLISQAQQTENQEEKDKLLHETKSKINLRMNFSDERSDFDSQVEELHKDFGIRLANRFPDLTAQEKKLAAMLRLDFPTKYIATILNISPKSVEIERHRLRKKIGLDRKTKLTDFVKTI